MILTLKKYLEKTFGYEGKVDTTKLHTDEGRQDRKEKLDSDPNWYGGMNVANAEVVSYYTAILGGSIPKSMPLEEQYEKMTELVTWISENPLEAKLNLIIEKLEKLK